jgi:hypothetical protein
MRTARKVWDHHISFLRSTRSVITPAGSVNTSHGILEATATIAISRAFRVTAEASYGNAIVVTPSPRFEITLDVQRFQ